MEVYLMGCLYRFLGAVRLQGLCTEWSCWCKVNNVVVSRVYRHKKIKLRGKARNDGYVLGKRRNMRGKEGKYV